MSGRTGQAEGPSRRCRRLPAYAVPRLFSSKPHQKAPSTSIWLLPAAVMISVTTPRFGFYACNTKRRGLEAVPCSAAAAETPVAVLWSP